MLFSITSLLCQNSSTLVTAVPWSPDGKRLAGIHDAQKSNAEATPLEVWDMTTLQSLFLIEGTAGLCMPWPGSLLAGILLRDRTVQIWEASSGQLVLTYQGHSQAISALSWAPGGALIASGSDTNMQVWHAATGRHLFSYWKPPDDVEAVAWSPDGTCLAVGTGSRTVEVLRMHRRGRRLRTQRMLSYQGHLFYENQYNVNGVYEVAWSPDGKRLASAGGEGTLQVWDVATGQTIFMHPLIVRYPVWSPDGAYLAATTAGHKLCIWDGATGKTLFTHRYFPDATGVAYAPEGTHLALGGLRGKVRIFEAVREPLHLLAAFWLRLRG